MNMMKKLMALLLAVLMCGAVVFAETSADDVMCTVNGTVVTRGEYEAYLVTLQNYYYEYGYDVTDATVLAALQMFALQTGIEYAVMDQKIVELGLELTEAEKTAATEAAMAEWEATIESGLTYYGITEESTEEERALVLVSVLAELESYGYTEETYLADELTFAAYDKLFAYVVQDVVVSEEEVLAYYDELVATDKELYANDAASYETILYYNEIYTAYGMSDYVVNVYYVPEGYRTVTHILLGADETLLANYATLQATYEEQQLTLEEGGEVTDELVTAEAVEEARLAILADVQPVLDEINQKLADGAEFADLILEYTTDTGMNTADAVAQGYDVHMDSVNWVIPFRDAAFTVDNIGDITEPVVTDYGVHILQYVADIPGGPLELTDEMYNAFYSGLLAAAQDDAYYVAVTEWVEAADIVYSEEAEAILGLGEEAVEETTEAAE